MQKVNEVTMGEEVIGIHIEQVFIQSSLASSQRGDVTHSVGYFIPNAFE